MKKIFAVFIVLTIFLCSCTEISPIEQEIFAMDTLMTIRIWGDEALSVQAVSEINRLDAMFSVTNENSEISRLNSEGTNTVDAETVQLINRAVEISERTDGAFDPTVYPLIDLWGFLRETQNVPSREELDSVLSSVGADQIVVQGETISLLHGGKIDLGGIAKGYTAQYVTEFLKSKGVETAFLSLGGNVQTLGSKPDGSEWIIGIADPNEPSQAVAVLHFFGSMALVTSGGYQRYFERDGIRYHHILDRKSGCPADTGIASVTVIAQDGTLADGLSTALFVMGMERGTDLWRKSDDFEAVFIMDDGKIYVTSGASAMIKDCEYTVIER